MEKEESDAAYFDALMYVGEMVVKLVVAGMVAAVHDDRERHRYQSEYRLVRADSLGAWVEVLDDILTGPSVQFLDTQVKPTLSALTSGVSAGAWQVEALEALADSLRCVQITTEELPVKVQARKWFKDFVHLRNATRGHGAPSTAAKGRACVSLERSIFLVASNLPILSLPWAYLHQNLSGKYRVFIWGNMDEKFEQLKRDTTHALANGVYICMDELCHVKLVDSDSEGLDYWFANGNFNEKRYEMLSYLTNNRDFRQSEPYSLPAQSLPSSETQGRGQLILKNDKAFTNLPDLVGDYVPRKQLENELLEQLSDLNRHFIVTLNGRGGIGKTSTALQVITKLIDSEDCPYEVVVWFSARDVDLLESGPKPVRPHGVSVNDFAKEYVNLLEPDDRHARNFDASAHLAHELSGKALGPTLFVFDNFETTTAPVDIFKWLDTHVRNPNKILITSRDRPFVGDYPVQVHGMAHDEALQLITQTADAVRLKIASRTMEELIEESDGHPYIIKLMIGEIARSGATSPERIMAGRNEALAALFERSYRKMTPAAERVFLTLCKWRSSVPALAVEAVLLRPQNDRIDVRAALDELAQSSFIEESFDNSRDESEVNVPLAARIFGLKKLDVSAWRASIEEDASMLHLFGAQISGTVFDLDQRIQRLFRNVADSLLKEKRNFAEVQPVLRYITTRSPLASALLADLVAELGMGTEEEEQHLLDYAQGQENEKRPAWKAWERIATIRRARGDDGGELDALAQICRRENTPVSILSNTANRVNTTLRAIQGKISRDERQFLIRDVETAIRRHLDELDATDLSRLGWLQVSLGEIDAALDTVRRGLKIDPDHIHCQRLEARLRQEQSP